MNVYSISKKKHSKFLILGPGAQKSLLACTLGYL